MKIDDNFAASSDVRSTQVGQTEQIERDQQARERPAEARSDSVSLSSLGSELARSISTESPAEISRIDRLQESVNSGTLAAPAQEVAGRVIEDALGGTALEAQGGGSDAPPSPL